MKNSTEFVGMTVVKRLRVSLANDPALTSNQKVASLLRLLKDDGKVERLEEKRKAYFRAL